MQELCLRLNCIQPYAATSHFDLKESETRPGRGTSDTKCAVFFECNGFENWQGHALPLSNHATQPTISGLY